MSPAAYCSFYYHSISRDTKWNAPQGAAIRYLSEGEPGYSGGEAAADAAMLAEEGFSASSALFWLLLPIVLPLIGLAICYWKATNEGLAHALRDLSKKRDRASKRRGTKAGGNFRHRQKLSQDGKGGRSANS